MLEIRAMIGSPNCGGRFEKRPTRPDKQLDKYPPSSEKIVKTDINE